jgi:DNA-directed RNA polymerase subunit RPC12/RpoP
MMIAPPRLTRPKPTHSQENWQARPYCPHCGSRLLLAERSRYHLVGRIDHFWTCDVCGTESATSIEVIRRAVA